MGLKETSIEKMGTTLAKKVVEKLEGDERLYQVIMDAIDEVIFENFGVEGLDEDIEMETSMVALQRISLTVN